MKGHRFRAILVLLAALLCFVGTGCDQTVDEYQNQKAQEQLARYEAIQGTYTGVVTSQDGKTQLGGIEITLEAVLQSGPPTSTGSTNSQAKINGIVAVSGAVNGEAGFSTASYNPEQGIFTGTLIVGSTTLTLSGTIAGSRMEGTITTSPYGSTSKFSARLNGVLPEPTGLTSGAPASTLQCYVGTARDPKTGEPQDVAISIQDAVGTVADSFVDFFVRSDVLVGLSIGGAPMLNFGGPNPNSTAQIGPNSKTLLATTQTSLTGGQAAVETLTCRTAGVAAWSCNFSSTNGSLSESFGVRQAQISACEAQD